MSIYYAYARTTSTRTSSFMHTTVVCIEETHLEQAIYEVDPKGNALAPVYVASSVRHCMFVRISWLYSMLRVILGTTRTT